MSIYLFKTEGSYGGETRVFTNKGAAYEYLATFEQSGAGVHAVIEEHIPTVSVTSWTPSKK